MERKKEKLFSEGLGGGNLLSEDSGITLFCLGFCWYLLLFLVFSGVFFSDLYELFGFGVVSTFSRTFHT